MQRRLAQHVESVAEVKRNAHRARNPLQEVTSHLFAFSAGRFALAA